MAEKRRAGFNIPLNFYDGPEVESIPKRIRAAAIGVWSLAGDYAATQLTDGYVPAGMLKMFGCTDAIRSALKVTINKKGELSPLWEDARNGGVQLTNWAKHQRTNEEVTAYRANEVERKRLAREAAARAAGEELTSNLRDNFDELTPNLSRNFDEDTPNEANNNTARVATGNATTSSDEKMSGRTKPGHGSYVRAEAGDPKTKTEPKTVSGYVTEESSPNVGGDERGLSAPITPSASRLVSVLIPDTIPAAVRTGLRISASELMNRDGLDSDAVAESLRRWLTRSGAGVGLLPHIAADVIRERAAPSNVRQLSAFDRKKAANATVFQALADNNHPEIES